MANASEKDEPSTDHPAEQLLSGPSPLTDQAGLAGHGAGRLAAVQIDTYNAELRDDEGFIGDRASGRAFRALLEEGRERVRHDDSDPIGTTPSKNISKKKLDRILADGDPLAAGVVLGTIEDFAREFTAVIRRIMRLPEWLGTERIVVGGGLRDSRIGELAIGRTAALLKADGLDVALLPIRHHPDEAGLLGCIHLAPSWVFSGHDSIIAVDIGGSNIRVGIVELSQSRSADMLEGTVHRSELWRHADDKPSRTEAVERMTAMIRDAIRRAGKHGLRLAPFIGLGCPGLIREDGSIAKGGHNLPGDWEHKSFNLPRLLRDAIPTIDGHEIAVLMHNDAVAQGLSEVPFMRDVTHWGVMTIGTGLGNARFTNRRIGSS